MFSTHSITGRMFIGVVSGLVLGIVLILLLPVFGFPLLSTFGFGTLIMFILMGMFIGMIGMFDYHPIFGFKMRWWIRGAVAGFLFMLMYILLGYASLEVVMASTLVSWTGLSSPFWALIDGTVIGLVIGLLETKIAGEGSHLPLE